MVGSVVSLLRLKTQQPLQMALDYYSFPEEVTQYLPRLQFFIETYCALLFYDV